jgi:hypothetical protein
VTDEPNPAASTSPGADPTRRAQTFLVAAMASGLVVIGLALTTLGAELTTPPGWMLGVLAAAVLGSWALVVVVLVPGRPGAAATIPAQALLMVRLAVLEAPAFAGLALAFLAEPPNLSTYLLPATFSLVGIALFATPGRVRQVVGGGAAAR